MELPPRALLERIHRILATRLSTTMTAGDARPGTLVVVLVVVVVVKGVPAHGS